MIRKNLIKFLAAASTIAFIAAPFNASLACKNNNNIHHKCACSHGQKCICRHGKCRCKHRHITSSMHSKHKHMNSERMNQKIGTTQNANSNMNQNQDQTHH